MPQLRFTVRCTVARREYGGKYGQRPRKARNTSNFNCSVPMRGRRAAIAVFLAALLAPMVASAGESDARAYAPPTPAYDWTITLGAEARLEPLFQGSSRERWRPYPIFAVRRFGTP